MRGGKVETMTNKTKEVLRQVACYVAVGVMVGIGPVLPLTACLVCVGGTVIFAYLYKCMQGQPLRLAFLICAILWLWGNTAVTLLDFTNAPLALALLVLGCVLVTGAGRWTRLGAFLLPVGALSLIPYGLRDWESAMATAACASIMYIFGVLCYLSHTFITRNKWLGYGLPYILFTSLVTFFFIISIDDMSTRELWTSGVGILIAQTPDLCAILSRHCLSSCGIKNSWWLGTCSALSCLAPLGALNFCHNIEIYLLTHIF